jgi:hypothetical protein
VKPDHDEVIRVLKPYQTPLLQWLWFMNLPSREVKNAYGKFSWFENEFFPHQTQITTAITASTTLTLTPANVGSISIFNEDDIVLIEDTEELAYVSAVSAGTSVTLTHIDGSTELSDVDTTETYLKIIGSRNSEYGSARTAMTTKEVEKYNYLNIFSESIATSGRAQAGEAYSDGMTHDELVEKRIEELKLQIERYFLFAPAQGYATTGNYRTTWGHGLLGRITSNVNTYSSSLTESVFDAHLKEIFQKGSNRKLHICGSNQLAEINDFIKDRYEINENPEHKQYGIHVKEYITPFGLVDIMWDPVMDGKFVDFGFPVDADKLRLRYMAEDKKGPRKFRLEEHVETPGVDGTTTKILFDVGMELHNEECHGILKKS